MKFKPAFGLKNPHLQTLFPSFFRKVLPLPFEVETFTLPDDDFVECYWYKKPQPTNHNPIVVLFHGLEGSFSSPYIYGMMKTAQQHNYPCVIMHFRGCGLNPNKVPKSYHSGETQDAKAWLTHLKEQYPQNELYCVGYSLGGNMLLKLLGELKENTIIAKAVSVSAPLDLEICANTLNKGTSKLYQTYLMKFLKNSLLQKYQQHDMQKHIGIKEEEVKTLKTFWEFDDVYTAPINGFGTAKNYYEKASSKPYLKHIKTYTLIIQALDDPFMTPEIIPTKEELSNTITLEVHQNGGHVGFVGGSVFKPSYCLEERVMRFFNDKKI